MLESNAPEASLTKKAGKKAIDAMYPRLGEVQRRLWKGGVRVLIVFEGSDAAGKGSAIGRLMHAFDPRGFKVHHVHPATDLERLFPPMRRFWNLIPGQGEIVILNHSWYRQMINEPLEDEARTENLEEAAERIRCFERQLTEDGTVLIKFFLHISKAEQAKRFKKLSKDPAFAWKVGKVERKRHKRHDQYAQCIETMLRDTSTACAPWTVVPAEKRRYRDVRVAEVVLAALEQALLDTQTTPPDVQVQEPESRTGILDSVDLSLAVEKKSYREQLPELQQELRRLQHLCYVQRIPVVIVFEGWDAAGKGGAIRRLTRELDPRGYAVIPIGAPKGEEKHKHYLWRFWRALRKAGHFSIYDRSWYGRVMVERVEGFASQQEWLRAYREINEFESDLLHYGAVLCKFWMHISKDEQLRRFEARQNNPAKQWKLTEEDWRNREKWDLYWQAVSDMIDLNSTAEALWTIVEGDSKRYARLKVLQVVIDSIRAVLDVPERP